MNEVLSEQIERSLLPDWTLGTYSQVDVTDIGYGRRSVKMVPIRELRSRLVTPYSADGSLKYRKHTSSSDMLVDSYYIDHPEAIDVLVSSSQGQPVVALPNLREFICFRFSPMDGHFHIGTNILSYIALLENDAHIKYKTTPREEYQIPATSVDVAYFASWVFCYIWRLPVYIFMVTVPIVKAYCIVYHLGWWHPIYNRNIVGYVEDNKFKTVEDFVKWLKVSPCARKISFSETLDDLLWIPYNKEYFEKIQRGLL